MNSAKKNFVKKSCQLLGKVVRELRTRRGSFQGENSLDIEEVGREETAGKVVS